MTGSSEGGAGGEPGAGTRRRPLADLDPRRRELVAAARAARANAMPRYSNFPVGAAVETADGRIVPGCNVEISTYGLTLCAERVALFAACAAGAREFRAVAVVGPEGERTTPPCGACRQVIWDLAGDVEVLMAAGDQVEIRRSSELLPDAFGPDRLAGH